MEDSRKNEGLNVRMELTTKEFIKAKKERKKESRNASENYLYEDKAET